MRTETKSEFGKGFGYCLGLFIAHEFRKFEYIKNEADIAAKQDPNIISDVSESSKKPLWPGLYMNGAGDHLFEFMAEEAPESLRERSIILKERCLAWRYEDSCSWTDVDWAINEAKNLLLDYDKLNGFDAEKGTWE